MTPTRALITSAAAAAAVLLSASPASAMTTTDIPTATTVCEAYGLKQHDHWVAVGATEPGTWGFLLSHGWSREAGTTAVVLFADGCSY